jgi:hypothetical protein
MTTSIREVEPRFYMFEMGEDFVVALDLEDAWAVWCETTGCTRGGDDLEESDVAQVRDDRVFKCWVDEAGDPCDHGEGVLQEHTAEEWARQLGRCFAFSDNY